MADLDEDLWLPGSWEAERINQLSKITPNLLQSFYVTMSQGSGLTELIQVTHHRKLDVCRSEYFFVRSTDGKS